MGDDSAKMMEREGFLTLSEFEERFWSESDSIRISDPKVGRLGRHYVTQHPSRSKTGPGEKHVNELLPLLILAKHEAGLHSNWGSILKLSPSFGEDRVTSSGLNFDAGYYFEDRNHGLDSRSGHIEITRGITDAESQELKAEDRDLSIGSIPEMKPRDILYGLEEMCEGVLKAVEKKVKIFRCGKYPDDTALLVWMRMEANLSHGRAALSDSQFKDKVRLTAKGAFKRVCIVGQTCGVIWVVGDGL